MKVNTAPRTKTFLLVDDDNDDSGLFTEALAAIAPGIVCHLAGDGQECFSKLEKLSFQPDMIFLDINMPVMNGWECLSQLKKNDNFRDIPVIIHTTSARLADRELARDLGALCFFTKPSDFKTLKMMLQLVVQHLDEDSIEELCEAVYKRLRMN